MSIFWALGKKPALESWVEGFWSDSVDTCIMGSGNERDNKLWVDEDVGESPKVSGAGILAEPNYGRTKTSVRVLKFRVQVYSQNQA
jgi:hypothetical protein